jgi:hypothetical protein
LRDVLRLPYHPILWRLNRNDDNTTARADDVARRLDALDRRVAELEVIARTALQATVDLHGWSRLASAQIERSVDLLAGLDSRSAEPAATPSGTVDVEDLREVLIEWAAAIARNVGTAADPQPDDV